MRNRAIRPRWDNGLTTTRHAAPASESIKDVIEQGSCPSEGSGAEEDPLGSSRFRDRRAR